MAIPSFDPKAIIAMEASRRLTDKAFGAAQNMYNSCKEKDDVCQRAAEAKAAEYGQRQITAQASDILARHPAREESPPKSRSALPPEEMIAAQKRAAAAERWRIESEYAVAQAKKEEAAANKRLETAKEVEKKYNNSWFWW